MDTYTYTIELEPAEEGGYVVTVPALPGCVTQGETEEEAIAMAEDAIKLWIETLIQGGQSVPKEPTTAGRISKRVSVHVPAQV